MIAIFTLVGLVLFGGGLYAIRDGWPYLVLEHGFTEVIMGSVAAMGGLIMMSLAWVLKQLKTIRRQLTEAAEARAAADVVMPLAPADPTLPTEAFFPSRAAPIAVGAGAAAVAVGIAEPAEGAASASALERDLFGAVVADQSVVTPDEDKDGQDEPAETAGGEALREETARDMFEVAAAEPAEADRPIAVEEESSEPAEVVAARVQPIGQDEALAHSDEQAEADDEELEEAIVAEPAPEEGGAGETPSELEGAAIPDRLAAEVEDPAPAKESTGRDEFAALRESLTDHLGVGRRPAGRIEPSFTLGDDSFVFTGVAESPVQLSTERQEPHLKTEPHFKTEPRFEIGPSSSTPDEPELEAPAWPPRTEAPSFASPSAGESGERDQAEADTESATDRPPESDETAPAARESADEAVSGDEDAVAAAPEPAVQAPAASEEGIVGAYQVGETHFTIFADGSIRARTPDGEYSFASMDELKVYLASEKSRLGA